MILSNEEFISILRKKMEDSGLNQSEFARRLGEKRESVLQWRRDGIKRDKVRQRVISAHPELFSSDGIHADTELVPVEIPKRKKADAIQQMRTAVKTEFARHHVASLENILVWFLFQATSEERNQFRDDLGDAWKEFLSLTRAMTGETALEITKGEGGLQKWEQER